MSDVWQTLAAHLGDPPVEFEFAGPVVMNTDRNIVTKNRPIMKFTPASFRDWLKFDSSNYVSVIASKNIEPDKVFEIYRWWDAASSPGDPRLTLRRLNSTVERMMEMTGSSIRSGTPVVFTGDVNKDIYFPKGIMDPELFARDVVYPSLRSTRETESVRWDRLFYRLTIGNHNMLFVGEDRRTSPLRLR